MRKPKNQMVRITSGAVPRLRLMSVRSNRGRRFRTVVAFTLSFLLAAYGFYGANSLAQSPPRTTWVNQDPSTGTVEVEVLTNTLNSGVRGTLTYRLRLTKQPITDGWWVRIHVNNMVVSDGIYPPNVDREDAMITWVPSVGWEFDPDNSDLNQPTQWRTVTIRAEMNFDINTPITGPWSDSCTRCGRTIPIKIARYTMWA